MKYDGQPRFASYVETRIVPRLQTDVQSPVGTSRPWWASKKQCVRPEPVSTDIEDELVGEMAANRAHEKKLQETLADVQQQLAYVRESNDDQSVL